MAILAIGRKSTKAEEAVWFCCRLILPSSERRYLMSDHCLLISPYLLTCVQRSMLDVRCSSLFVPYGAHFGAKKGDIGTENTYFWDAKL